MFYFLHALFAHILRSMAVELGPYNIRVNSIAPTVVMTEMGKMAWSDPKKAQSLLNRIPLGRFAGTNKS
jgi:L-xylulose reductase